MKQLILLTVIGTMSITGCSMVHERLYEPRELEIHGTRKLLVAQSLGQQATLAGSAGL